MYVHNGLGPGHREVVYQPALMARLEDMGIDAVAEQPVEICFAGRPVGLLYMDCLVEDAVIVEKKRDGWRDRIECYLWRPPETREWLEGQGN
jgi:GxxExxY protein